MSKSEKILNNSLKAHGYLFPENEEQLISFLDEIKNITVPTEITDPEECFSFERKKFRRSIQHESDKQVINNLAQAARKGSSIPDEILKKMRQDRQNSQKGGK